LAGVGFDLSHIRPNNASVTNSAGTSTGAISFMHRFSHTAREVGQDGRRGALMLSININHPDIEEFITSKSDLTKITGANISVKVDDKFMKAVENDENYILYFRKEECFSSNPSKAISIKAKTLWNKLIHQATKTAEPGILYWDTIERESIPSCYREEWKETSTNPCGEIPLCPYDSCRLMSVNLYSFVEKPFTDKAYFNYDKFKEVVYKAQRLMDDIVDLEEEKINLILNKIENDPEPEEIKIREKDLWIKIKNKLISGRRTGLSAIGLADCFAAMHIQYGSDISIDLAEEIYKQFAIAAYKSSIDMAEERGAFPIWDWSKEGDNPFIERIILEFNDHQEGAYSSLDLKYRTHGRRNIALLTIPPSGTISLLANLSSGIEPAYQLYYKRRRKINPEDKGKKVDFVDQNGDSWEEYTILHPKFKEWLDSYLSTKTEDQIRRVNVGVYDVNKLKPVITEIDYTYYASISPYRNSTSYEIDPLQRVKLQAIIQKWIDHSISSTINLKKGTTEEEVSNLYFQAWKLGCKGLTIYVDESRTGVLVSHDTNTTDFKQHNAPKRPKELVCNIHSTKVRGESFLVVVGLLDNKPYEVFVLRPNGINPSAKQHKIIKLNKGNYILTTIDWNNKDEGYNFGNIVETLSDEEKLITRLISTSLRHGSSIQFVVEQLNKSTGDITSFGKAIARVLKTYIPDQVITGKECDECKSTDLRYESGCVICNNCGFSKCG
jgi:ribonucleoside-diphosphate reductase alpha chain